MIDQPRRPANIFVHPDKYAGKSVKVKLAELRELILKNNASGMYITMLDEVAWFLQPVWKRRQIQTQYFIATPFVAADKAVLYVDALKVDESVDKTPRSKTVSVSSPTTAFYEGAGQATEGKYLITNKAPMGA